MLSLLPRYCAIHASRIWYGKMAMAGQELCGLGLKVLAVVLHIAAKVPPIGNVISAVDLRLTEGLREDPRIKMLVGDSNCRSRIGRNSVLCCCA
jgi:hypothetical protein